MGPWGELAESPLGVSKVEGAMGMPEGEIRKSLGVTSQSNLDRNHCVKCHIEVCDK